MENQRSGQGSSESELEVIVVLARELVGFCELRDVCTEVREAMYRAAHERTLGNVHAAARLLGVDRAAVRRAWRVLGLESP